MLNILGLLAERPTKVYAYDAEAALDDVAVCFSIVSAQEPSYPGDGFATALRTAVRCADLNAIERISGASTKPDLLHAFDPYVHHLGRSLCAVRKGNDCTYLGPDVDQLFSALRALQNSGLDLNGGTAAGELNLLTDAVARGPELVRRLLGDGLDPSRRDGAGRTPLSYAAQFLDTEVTAVLLDGGAPVNDADRMG